MVKTMGYTAAPVVVAGDEHWSGFAWTKSKLSPPSAGDEMFDVVYFSSVSETPSAL